jgi:N6-L-threonylcarbamoyladenine synthase
MILAIESSCDESCAAVVVGGRLLSSVVSSQAGLHAEYGGVVPELAAREHLRNLAPVCRAALREAGVHAAAITAVAVTRGPGLPAALMAGTAFARGLASALGVPVHGIHHHEAHLYSPWAWGAPLEMHSHDLEPHVGLIVSGGHTMLVHVPAEGRHEIVGETLDDAAGECFDKAAKLMRLPYPGGPWIERLAADGDPEAIRFPRPRLAEPDEDFSFSGLKTSVRYWLEGHPGAADDAGTLRNLCAGVQAAIVEPLAVKAVRAARRRGVRCVTVSGGVARNGALRRELQARCDRHGLKVRFAEASLCGDNAAMVGLWAWRAIALGRPPAGLDEEPDPAWGLGDVGQEAKAQ